MNSGFSELLVVLLQLMLEVRHRFGFSRTGIISWLTSESLHGLLTPYFQ